MRSGGRVLIILGLFLAIVSGGGVFFVLANAQPSTEPVPTTKLVVAYQNVGERTEVGTDQVGAVDWPQTIPTPTGAFADPANVVGKFAVHQIYPGQPIIASMLIDKEAIKEKRSNAAYLLAKGKVAMAFPVTTISGVARAIQAGDPVDVIATFSVNLQREGQQGIQVIATQRTLQDVLILQVGAWPSAGAEPAAEPELRMVTFQVDEQDALVLKFIEENATSVSLALRAAGDHDLFNPEPVTLQYVNTRFGYKIPLAPIPQQ
jgi:Flp pilus assembly protein CpaB